MSQIIGYLTQYFAIIWRMFTDITIPILNVSVGTFMIGLFMVYGLLFGIIETLKKGFDEADNAVRKG